MRTSVWFRGVIAAVALCLMLSLAAQVVLLREVREDRWNTAVQDATNVLRTLETDIARNFEMVDLSLQGAQDAMGRVDLSHLDPVVRNMVLFDRAASASYLGIMMVLSPSGSVLHDAGSLAPRQVDLSDRDYFRAQIRAPQSPFVSRPFNSRLSDDTLIALSRRLSGPDNSFAGVVSAGISLRFFRSIFSQVDLGPHGTIELMRNDGQLVMQWPVQDIRQMVDAGRLSVLSSHLGAAEGGMFTATSPDDGILRQYIYREVGRFPLTLVVGFSINDVMELWRWQAIGFGVIGTLVAGAVIGLGIALNRAIEREMLMSRKLESLATTDALTGLANRRRFDEHLRSTASSTARAGRPLALMMIDVDHFKAVNDRFGHRQGDAVLQRIGHAIAGCARRLEDCVARYGGEEFAVILPGADMAAASRMAEAMRRAVETMPGSDEIPVTVSIGLACADLMRATDGTRLLADADAALYRAKANGRNRVERTGRVRPSPAGPAHPLPPEGQDRASA